MDCGAKLSLRAPRTCLGRVQRTALVTRHRSLRGIAEDDAKVCMDMMTWSGGPRAAVASGGPSRRGGRQWAEASARTLRRRLRRERQATERHVRTQYIVVPISVAETAAQPVVVDSNLCTACTCDGEPWGSNMWHQFQHSSFQCVEEVTAWADVTAERKEGMVNDAQSEHLAKPQMLELGASALDCRDDSDCGEASVAGVVANLGSERPDSPVTDIESISEVGQSDEWKHHDETLGDANSRNDTAAVVTAAAASGTCCDANLENGPDTSGFDSNSRNDTAAVVTAAAASSTCFDTNLENGPDTSGFDSNNRNDTAAAATAAASGTCFDTSLENGPDTSGLTPYQLLLKSELEDDLLSRGLDPQNPMIAARVLQLVSHEQEPT